MATGSKYAATDLEIERIDDRLKGTDSRYGVDQVIADYERYSDWAISKGDARPEFAAWLAASGWMDD